VRGGCAAVYGLDGVVGNGEVRVTPSKYRGLSPIVLPFIRANMPS